MSELYVDTGQLRAHASHVLRLSGKAGEATSAAHAVAFSPSMFGSIGSMLVGPAMAPLQAAGVAAASVMEGALGDCAEAVRGLADTFSFVDEAVGDHFDAIGRRIK